MMDTGSSGGTVCIGLDPFWWTTQGHRKKESSMGNPRLRYTPEFRRQMVEHVEWDDRLTNCRRSSV